MKTYNVETVPTVDTDPFRTTGISCTVWCQEESDGIRLSTPPTPVWMRHLRATSEETQAIATTRLQGEAEAWLRMAAAEGMVCALHARLPPVECWERIAARRVELGIIAPPTMVARRDALATILADVLRGTLHCTRSWQAWQVGTMTEHDFKPVETSDTPFELADAVIAFFAASQESHCDGQNRTVGAGETSCLPEPLAGELHDWWENGGDDKEPLVALICRGLRAAASPN